MFFETKNGGGWEIRLAKPADIPLFVFLTKVKNGGGWEIRTPAPGRPSLTI